MLLRQLVYIGQSLPYCNTAATQFAGSTNGTVTLDAGVVRGLDRPVTAQWLYGEVTLLGQFDQLSGFT